MKDNHLKNFLIVGLILLIISCLFPFIVNHFFNNWSNSGTFGDTFGALNALFSGLAFAGLITTILIQKTELQNQRLELELQRLEMKDTRKEFLLNRTTNLFYSQLERFERSIKELKITFNGIEYKGDSAISILNEIRELIPYDDKLTGEENLENKRQVYNRQLIVFKANKTEIEKFAHNSYNSVTVLQSLIYKSNLDIEELNDLKNLFFENIGFISMGIIENISNISKEELEIFAEEDYVRFNLDVGVMFRANIFFKPIVEFYNVRLNKDNFEELKEKWKKGKGSYV